MFDFSRDRALCVSLIAVCVLAILTTCLYSRSAYACGGFFCNSSQPVNQAAERIIFSQNGDGTVTAVVQILYQGDAESFSWLLPVPSVPEVGVSSNIAFSRLQLATNPVYLMDTEVEGDCLVNRSSDAGGITGNFDAVFAAADEGSSPITVEDSGSVGPYDYDVISVDLEDDDPVAAAERWLQDNGYDLGVGPDLIRPYLESGMMLIAFRLSNSAQSGEVRPVVLTFETDLPMIPIKLTAVAANRDMGVLVWVLGASRAIPDNYFNLVLNEALINWFSPSTTYNDVIIAAADEAGGQGFVTELAAPASMLEEIVWTSWEADHAQELLEQDWAGRESAVLWELERYNGWDGVLETVRDAVPLPDEVSPSDVLSCLDCYFEYGVTLESFDPAVFLDALFTNVIDPMAETQALIDAHDMVTRLYSTLSAEEMTLDPMFDFNPDLPDIDNIHTATRVIHCDESVGIADAPWSVELPQGDTVRGVGATWPYDLGSGQPVNREVQMLLTSGAPMNVIDNNEAISAAIEATATTTAGEGADTSGPGDSSGCACTQVTGSSPALWGLIALAAIACRRRQRARQAG